MKATDLRIGNYVIFKSIQMVTLNQNGKYENYEEPHQLHQIQISSNDFEYIEKGQSEYRPIPLTEEWLLKFGFVQSSNNLGNTFHILKKDGVIVMLTIEHWTNTDINSKYHNHWHCEYLLNGHKLQYLHQLQNLYFALTGEELTIKENEI